MISKAGEVQYITQDSILYGLVVVLMTLPNPNSRICGEITMTHLPHRPDTYGPLFEAVHQSHHTAVHCFNTISLTTCLLADVV